MCLVITSYNKTERTLPVVNIETDNAIMICKAAILFRLFSFSSMKQTDEAKMKQQTL